MDSLKYPCPVSKIPKPELEIRERGYDYHVQIKDEPGYWSCGQSIRKTIKSLTETFPEKFVNGHGDIYYKETC